MSTAIYWFRNALRMHDNIGLTAVSKASLHLNIYILDLDSSRELMGTRRRVFLWECLRDLDNQLKKKGSRLYVLYGNPLEIFTKLTKTQNLVIHYEVNYEPYFMNLDAEIGKLVKTVEYPGQTMYDPDQVLSRNHGKVPTKYATFCKLVEDLTVKRPIEPPESFGKIDATVLENLLGTKYSGPNQNFELADLDSLGIVDNFQGFNRHAGGETAALKQMDLYLSNEKRVAEFEKPKTAPTAFNPPSTTVLSPHIRFGTLSCRTFYHALIEIEQRVKKHSLPPTSLVGQLLWREFYYTNGFGTSNFHKMKGNPICIQIDWKLQNREDAKDSVEFNAWKNGKTGFPFIDAIMTQLRLEGWIHHLARHAVACFLTRGDLYISWERGQEVFEELLLDADYFLNAGNWMWLSASCFFYQYFRVYSPIAFGKSTDKQGNYIRKYVPALKKVPTEFIYEPWKMSLAQQKLAGCIIGEDYPAPIVNHDAAKQECMAGISMAYKRRKDK